jgi:hypothetical protein
VEAVDVVEDDGQHDDGEQSQGQAFGDGHARALRCWREWWATREVCEIPPLATR